MVSDRPIWFAPKRYGIGTGLPIAWQGWALDAAFIALILGVFHLFGNKHSLALAILAPAFIIYVVIAAWTTKGGWRWRRGEEE